jgi:hypothetical protein
MTDILIRDVPDETIAELDAAAARTGVSRVEYLRRTLAAEAERLAREERPALTADDWSDFADRFADLADEQLMRKAWE